MTPQVGAAPDLIRGLSDAKTKVRADGRDGKD